MNKEKIYEIIGNEADFFNPPKKVDDVWILDPKDVNGQSLVVKDDGEIITYAQYIMEKIKNAE